MTGMIMDIAAIIGAIIALVGTAVSVGVSSMNKADELEKTDQLNSQNIEFTREENAINRQREDNYLQRRVADATAAGLSPLSVADNQPASATVSVPQNTFMPNIGQYGVGMADAIQKGFSEAGSNVFEAGQNDKRIQSAERQLASTLANNSDISAKQEATKRFCAQLGADTQTQNTIAEIISREKIDAYDNAARVAGGITWLASDQAEGLVFRDVGGNKRSIPRSERDKIEAFYKKFPAYKTSYGYDLGYFIQARAYMKDSKVPLADRTKFMLSFEYGKRPSVPNMYTFSD